MAPGDYHMSITPDGAIELLQSEPIWGLRPAADVTMRSAASIYGEKCLGVVLTGMGHDGTNGASFINNGTVR